jgi:hypothetical protein
MQTENTIHDTQTLAEYQQRTSEAAIADEARGREDGMRWLIRYGNRKQAERLSRTVERAGNLSMGSAEDLVQELSARRDSESVASALATMMGAPDHLLDEDFWGNDHKKLLVDLDDEDYLLGFINGILEAAER